MKKYLYPILSAIAGSLVLGIVGFIKFMSYGGNSCDFPGKNCSCFCCHLFGLRGYESCADFGLLAGLFVGALAGLSAYWLIRNIFKPSK
jgi:hypothetical protein